MPRARVHQHVNPLSPHYRQEPEPVDVASVFANPDLPLLLDIGCARGRFLLRMAETQPEWNYLGVEIREPLVEEANLLASVAGLVNLHYMFCNAMIWLERLIENIPKGRLQIATIQFPDPWFKKKHAKRRMVNAALVNAVTNSLSAGGKIFIQTDIEFLAAEMFDLFDQNTGLSEIAVTDNPFPVRTEREIAVENKALRVYRSSWEKIAISSSFLS